MAKRSVVLGMRFRAIAAIALISLTGCNQSSATHSIETLLKTEIEKQSGISVKTITCPKNLQAQPDQEFECTGALNPEGGFFIQVRATAEKDKVNWEIPHSWRLLNLAKLESEVQAVLGQTQTPEKPDLAQSVVVSATPPLPDSTPSKATPPKDGLPPFPKTLKVDCGGGYRAIKPGDSFECKLVDASASTAPDKSPPSATLPSTSRDIVSVKIEPEGKITWQAIREEAGSATKAAAIGSQTPAVSPASGSLATPAAPTTSTSSNGAIEAAPQDATGWRELGE
ncbi:DUF4333 domain-containing protein [Alkalinema sp. FACHB-956]|uniref:DUF4333 domain-containing protein n=1 Tax=Alkalinema sp. FACHB-956 TaxID=2692768 RepID=UPI0016825359|nr:DUF4333 domain-containing protein [Alkalinema sp. FACHB-956]MBD2330001.1 DUF4333 domain-containing protein [Alkalinema sp. FACHB-956]